jgi:virginiamycin B lyase
MATTGNGIIVQRRLALTLGLAATALLFSAASPAQQVQRGTINGRVTSDQGQVIGFRVAAHNLDRRLWYTVFTKSGQYTVPQALPGRYEVMVEEAGYISPKLPVQISPGASQTADIVLKKQAPEELPKLAHPNLDSYSRYAGARTVYVNSMDEIFPPGPGLDLMKENCTGCHGGGMQTASWGPPNSTKEEFMRGIERMTETGPGYNSYVLALGRTPLNKSQKELIADYLVKNFGPGQPERRLRVDPLVPDEDVVSKQIYVSYDLPEDLPYVPGGNKIGANMLDGIINSPLPPDKYMHLGSTFISPVDGNIWFSSRSSSSMLRLNPTDLDSSERWHNYPIKGDPYVHPDGTTVDKQGHVYWAELRTGMLGELDPATGKQIRHALPQQVGALHEVIADKDGNIDFDLIWGAEFGRMDATTRKIHMYPTPTPDNGLYGMALDQHGNMWAGGWQKGTINKFDIDTQSVTEYRLPNSWGQIRRISVDSKGTVWAGEYNTGILAKLNPATGEITEYKIPLSGANCYETWPDKSDNIWIADPAHGAFVKFDQKSLKFTFYPGPQPHQSINKIQVATDNTIWFGTRSLPIGVATHFYPNGYTADAPPEP